MPLNFLDCRHGSAPRFCSKCKSVKELQAVPIMGPGLAAMAEAFFVIDEVKKIKRKVIALLEPGEKIVPRQAGGFISGGIVPGPSSPDTVPVLINPGEMPEACIDKINEALKEMGGKT